VSSCKHHLGKTLVEILEQACIKDVPEGDKTRADIVGLRKVIGSYRLAITVLYFDPMLQEQWIDERADGRRDQQDAVWLPARDTTSEFERIRGAVLVQANLSETAEDAIAADEVVQEVVARAKRAIRQNRSKLWFEDSYQQAIFDFHIVAASEYDSGGENSHITREYIRWVALLRAKEK
jgi:hypothetical protein